MAAQASAFLIQADILPAIKPVLWDTSAVLSEKSFFGQALHTLIGYVDRPSGMQLLVYLFAIVLIGGLTLAARKPEAIRPAGVLAAITLSAFFLALFTASPVHASHKVYYPKVEQGETEIELRGHVNFDKDPAINNAQTYKFGVGHGLTDFWFSEIYVEVKKDADSTSYVTEAYEWENLFQLTEPGKYWADLGLNIEYVHARSSSEPNELELIPIVQKQVGQHLFTLNIPFARETGNNASNNWELEYAWQYKLLGNPVIEFGLEGYGKLGEVTHWDSSSHQRHQMGPSLFGKLKTGLRHAWKYQLGLQFGLTESTPEKLLYGYLEYEF